MKWEHPKFSDHGVLGSSTADDCVRPRQHHGESSLLSFCLDALEFVGGGTSFLPVEIGGLGFSGFTTLQYGFLFADLLEGVWGGVVG